MVTDELGLDIQTLSSPLFTIFNYAQKSHVHFLNDIFYMQTVAGPKCLSIYVVQSGCRDQNLPSNRIQMTQTS